MYSLWSCDIDVESDRKPNLKFVFILIFSVQIAVSSFTIIKCLFYLALSTFDSFLGADAGFFFVLLVGAHCVGNEPPPEKNRKNYNPNIL